jgi:intraflagellar transport protein 81
MEELRLVVSELNKPPFSKGLSLVTLDEKSPIELLQLVIDVLSEMDAKMRRDIRHEPKDAVVYSIVDFVAMLNYKPAIDNRGEFQRNLAAGWPESVSLVANTDHLQIIVK